MIARRAAGAALRRGMRQPSTLFSPALLAARLSSTPARPTTSAANPPSTHLTAKNSHEILARQRLNRPLSPHLGIYKMEQTWFGASAWTRITGCTLSGAAYLYFTSYLFAPLLGWHIESASLAAGFAALPLVAKASIKFFFAFPFVFHSINGVKHLIYDMGKGFSKPAIKKGEMALWASSILGGLYLAVGM